MLIQHFSSCAFSFGYRSNFTLSLNIVVYQVSVERFCILKACQSFPDLTAVAKQRLGVWYLVKGEQ